MTGWRRWTGRLLTWALVGLAVYFLGRAIWRNWAELSDYRWSASPTLLLASVLAHVLVLGWGVFVWTRVLARFGTARVPFPTTLRIWAVSNAARYIPGAVWQFLAAARMAGGAKLPPVILLTSMIVHVVVSLAAAAIVAVATLSPTLVGLPAAAAAPLLAATLLAAVLGAHPKLINGALRLIPRALHKDVVTWSGGWMDGIRLLGLSLISWVLYGMAFFLFVRSLAPVAWEALPSLTGVNALAFLAGYLAVPAPGGIGVREGMMALLLSSMLPTGVAAVVSIGARLWSIAAEVALVAAAAALSARS